MYVQYSNFSPICGFLRNHVFVPLRVFCACVEAYVFVCMYIRICMHVHTYLYACMCVCVCVCILRVCACAQLFCLLLHNLLMHGQMFVCIWYVGACTYTRHACTHTMRVCTCLRIIIVCVIYVSKRSVCSLMQAGRSKSERTMWHIVCVLLSMYVHRHKHMMHAGTIWMCITLYVCACACIDRYIKKK